MPVSTPNGYLDFTNATPRATKVIATSNVGIGTSNPEYGLDLHGTANVGALTATSTTVSGNVYVPNMPLAPIASNLVTYDSSTGLVQDSGGLFSNKLSVVSEQPPSALSGASTTVEKHGIYKLTASTGTPQNAFDKVTSTTWTASSNYGGGGGTGVYVGSTTLATGLATGDWLAVEFPYKATLRHLTLTAGDGLSTSLPEKANLYATNDTVTWTELKNWQAGETTVLVNATEPYKKYAIVTTKTVGNATLQIGQLKLFCESFSVDGGKIEMATSAVTGGETVVEQTTAHAREPAVLKKYPEVVFADGKFEYNDTTSTYTQGGYTVTASTTYDAHYAIKAFNGVPNDFFHWQNSSFGNSDGSYSAGTQSFEGTSGEWLKLQLPKKIRPTSTSLYRRDFDGQSPKDFKIYASVSGSSWTLLTEQTGVDNWTNAAKSYAFDTDIYYKYFAILVTKITRTNSAGAQTSGTLGEWELYGYEETATEGDTSLDTTIVSKYNTPDLTSASLYLDGLKGSTATDYSGRSIAVTENNVTWDSTEKSWTLSGAATSNVVSADLGLEGDQPHSVSAWVKADQLGYGTPLFHVGTTEGEGDAASRVGFVDDSHISWGGEDHFFSNAEWHNVTYTYNGEGSDKKLYLDGRLVGTAKNEDTFGDYPPFAMTTYSQYGYTVSASSELSNYPVHYAFDGNTTHAFSANSWICAAGKYEATSGTGLPVSPAETTTVDGVSKEGEWVQMEFPQRMIFDSVSLAPQTDTEQYRAPKDAVIAGSNDGTTWETMRTFTGETSWTDDVFNNYIIDTNVGKSYKYVRIIVLRNQGTPNSGTQYTSLAEIKFYARRENDLVRFPDPTNVLKYPHVAMTGPAQRGYVATASSYRADATYDYRPYKAFNGIFNSGLYQGWVSQSGTTEYNGTDYLYNGSINLGTGAQNGEWIKLELPRKILMTSMRLYSRDGDPTRAPEDFIVYGSNDDSNWTELLSEVGATPADTGTTYTADTATTHYTYFALVVRKIAGQNSYLTIDNIEYYGTEEDLDVVARVGDGYDGKVRNLRVFSTALSQDRVQEIFDADKDEFALAKSSVSVYRGHLGIGTTEPKAALTVMDEVGELEEFPPRAMTDYETYMEGHGLFRASASSAYIATPRLAWKAFNKDPRNSETGWQDGNNQYTGASSGTASGTTPTYTGSENRGGINGEWVSLEFPYKVKLNKLKITSYFDSTFRGLNDGFLLGRNDKNSEWTRVQTFTNLYAVYGARDTPQLTAEIGFTNDNYYNEYTLIATSTTGHTNWTAMELRYFGTREQGASTLHNGELTLTRNLTVPRIGPALDADDTPRRDRLVVEYNTSTNPTENGVVKDTSGRGVDGAFYGGAYYDAIEKALVFDGSNDYIEMSKWTHNTGFVHSFSGWIKFKSPEESWNAVYSVGNDTGSGRCFTIYSRTEVNYFRTESDGGGGYIDHTFEFTGNMDTWLHIAVVKSSAQIDSTRIYINGNILPQTGGSSATNNVALPNTPQNFRLGSVGSSLNYFANMNFSNIKIYDVALTADEVKRLYDMGRCDEGHHVVNFSKTRVGIGLGDGEVPQSTLDVRGTFQGNSSLRFFVLNGKFPATGTTQDVTDLPAELIERADRIVFMQGMTVETNGDRVNWIRHGSSTWEVDIKYDAAVPKFLLSGFDASVTITSKEWRMFIVTT